jgi:hypothetical protein
VEPEPRNNVRESYVKPHRNGHAAMSGSGQVTTCLVTTVVIHEEECGIFTQQGCCHLDLESYANYTSQKRSNPTDEFPRGFLLVPVLKTVGQGFSISGADTSLKSLNIS